MHLHFLTIRPFVIRKYFNGILWWYLGTLLKLILAPVEVPVLTIATSIEHCRGYPEVMRSGQAARCLGVSKVKLIEAFKSGQISGTDTGTEFRFDRRDVARHWVEGQRGGSNW
ncbi:MAG: helix-turn-helix domain-containing protein [Planctomycetes bacterium]|nr:helix-turn-helix domain-containing protein [Planctomycetota bacterium]